MIQKARELRRRRREGGVRYFQPQPQQLPVLTCKERGCLVLGGNRAGKTVVGGAETAFRLLGDHPYKLVHRAPIKAWICSQDLPGRVKAKAEGEQETHKQLEELRRWIPKDALRGGSWESAFSPGELTLSLKNGSLAVFKSYDQGPLKFESDAIHWAWFDEEPDNKSIWTSTLLRLADYSGQWMMTATPVLSLLGKGWIEELWERRAEKGVGYETHQLYSYDNPHLNRGVLDELFGNLPDEEKLVRAQGAFARLGGRVLLEFDARRHLVDDFVPPRSWRHRALIDPGWHIAAHLFSAEDPEGNVFLYAEHYEGHQRPKYHVEMMDRLYRAYGSPPIQTLMDPSGEYQGRSRTGQETPADADEYRKAAREIQSDGKPLAPWLRIGFADNGDPYAWRVKRFLAADRLFVCRSLKMWLWEQERWVRQRERTGALATEKPVPDAPIDRNNHLMDCFVQGTLIETDQGPRPVEAIRAGDRVLTRQGYRPVQAAWETGKRDVMTVEFSNGTRLTGTPAHPIWTENRGWVSMDALRYLDIIQVCPTSKPQSTKASFIIAIPTLLGARIGSISRMARTACMSWSGKKRTGRCLPDIMSTIGTMIQETTLWRTWSVFPAGNIQSGITGEFAAIGNGRTWKAFCHWQPSGIVARRGATGTLGRQELALTARWKRNSPVCAAGNPSARSVPEITASALAIASRSSENCPAWMTRNGLAGTAARCSPSIATTSEKGVPVFVLGGSGEENQRAAVFNLQVAETPEYYANGVLVHNCTRYLINEIGEPKPREETPLIPGSQADYWRRVRQELDGPVGESAESMP